MGARHRRGGRGAEALAMAVGIHSVIGEAKHVGEASSDARLRPADGHAAAQPAGFHPHVARASHPFDVVDGGNLVGLGQQRDEAPAPDAREDVGRAGVLQHHRRERRDEPIRGALAEGRGRRVQALDIHDHNCHPAAVPGEAVRLMAESLAPGPAGRKARPRTDGRLLVVGILSL